MDTTRTDRLIEQGYEIVLRETYREHELVALTKVFPATANSSEYLHIRTGANDRFFQESKAAREGIKSGSADAARKFLQQVVDEWIADEEILPKLLPIVAADKSGEDLTEIGQELPRTGDVVYVFAMGYWRRGLVTRKTRTKAEVAYTTASSSGRVFRKLAPASQLLAD